MLVQRRHDTLYVYVAKLRSAAYPQAAVELVAGCCELPVPRLCAGRHRTMERCGGIRERTRREIGHVFFLPIHDLRHRYAERGDSGRVGSDPCNAIHDLLIVTWRISQKTNRRARPGAFDRCVLLSLRYASREQNGSECSDKLHIVRNESSNIRTCKCRLGFSCCGPSRARSWTQRPQ